MHHLRALAVCFTVAACSQPPADKASDTVATPATPAPTSGSGQFPTGTYGVSIQRSEIADTSLASNVGNWRLLFAPGGTVTIHLDTIPIATAPYTVTGDQIVVGSGNAVVCQGRGDGTFRWTATDSTLAFTAVEDRCPDRRLVFTIKPMTRQP